LFFFAGGMRLRDSGGANAARALSLP